MMTIRFVYITGKNKRLTGLSWGVVDTMAFFVFSLGENIALLFFYL